MLIYSSTGHDFVWTVGDIETPHVKWDDDDSDHVGTIRFSAIELFTWACCEVESNISNVPLVSQKTVKAE